MKGIPTIEIPPGRYQSEAKTYDIAETASTRSLVHTDSIQFSFAESAKSNAFALGQVAQLGFGSGVIGLRDAVLIRGYLIKKAPFRARSSTFMELGNVKLLNKKTADVVFLSVAGPAWQSTTEPWDPRVMSPTSFPNIHQPRRR